MNFNPKLISTSEFPFLKKETAHEYLNVLNVDAKYENFVRIFDENDNYVLVHYLSQSADPGLNDELMGYIGHVRGVIVDKHTKQVVCKSWGYTREEVVDNYKENVPVESHNYFLESREGTVLRLYFDKYSDKWIVSTHRKLCSTNFSKKFLTFDILDENGQDKTGVLSKNTVYIFLISSPQNALVYPINKESLLYVTNWIPATNMFMLKNPFHSVFKKISKDETVSLENFVQESKLYTKETCFELFNKEFNVFSRSAVLTVDEFNCVTPTIVKYVTRNYYDLKTLRGNTPNLKYRYYELLNEPEELDNLFKVFTDQNSKYQLQMAENEFDHLTKKIHSLYLEKYIYKNNKQLPKEEFVTLQRCHAWYLQHKGSKVTYDIVKNLLKNTACYYVIRMLKRLKNN